MASDYNQFLSQFWAYNFLFFLPTTPLYKAEINIIGKNVNC